MGENTCYTVTVTYPDGEKETKKHVPRDAAISLMEVQLALGCEVRMVKEE